MNHSHCLKPANCDSWTAIGWGLILTFHFGMALPRAAEEAPVPPAAPQARGGLRVFESVNSSSAQKGSNAMGSRPLAPTNLRLVQAVDKAPAVAMAATSPATNPQTSAAPFVIPVLVVSFFPTNGSNIDIGITGDVGDPVALIQEKTRRLTGEVVDALQDGSRYRAYVAASNPPALVYQVAGSMEYFTSLPTLKPEGTDVPMTDYQSIMEQIRIRDWVENKGVKEVWIWGYHGGKVGLWESNMSSRSGDVSNSDCSTNDLPVLQRTYTVYHYNYQRGASEAVEDHMHQIEALLNFVDGRHLTPPDRWSELLFWGKFVGSDKSHRIVRPGCGWAHCPPNALQDYDWANRVYVQTDMVDWNPDGSGRKSRINCVRWGCDSLRWFVYWMQHLPGPGNDLTFQGKRLNNWWVFVGDWDRAMEDRLKLVLDQ